jgi:hypothetical protein
MIPQISWLSICYTDSSSGRLMEILIDAEIGINNDDKHGV